MGIQINGATDSITAIDGTIDVVSAIGNAGVVTATAFVGNITGNVTGNINHTSALELQTGGVTRAHFNSSGHFGIVGITTFSDNVNISSNKKLTFNNPGLEIYHNNSNAYLDNNVGHFYIRNDVDGDTNSNIYIQAKSGENGVSVGNDGSVVLFYNNNSKLQTTNTGTYTTGIGTFTDKISVTGSQNSMLTNNQLIFDRAGTSYIDNSNNSGSLSFRIGSSYAVGLFIDSSANVSIPSKLMHHGDTDTFMEFGTNTITFDTGGSERLRIDSSGNVGIDETGTILGKFHVVGGRASGTAYNAAVFAGGQNSTSGSGVKLYLSGCENDPISRGVILESIMTDNANAHRFSILVGGSSAAPIERFRIASDGTVDFYGNQTNAPNGIFGFRYDRSNDTDLSIENLDNGSVNNNAGIRLASNHGNIKLRYFNNGGFYVQNSSSSGYLHYFTNNVSRLYIDSSGNVNINNQGTIATSNGNVGKTFGIKSTANNVIIGETTATSEHTGFIFEARQTGRSGNARIAQIAMSNDAGADGRIKFQTAPDGADVQNRLWISNNGIRAYASVVDTSYHANPDPFGDGSGIVYYRLNDNFHDSGIFAQHGTSRQGGDPTFAFQNSSGERCWNNPSDGAITIPNLKNSYPFSMAAWVNISSWPTSSNNDLIMNLSIGGQRVSLCIVKWTDRSTSDWSIMYGGANHHVFPASSRPTNEWIHVVYSVVASDNTSHAVYQNGSALSDINKGPAHGGSAGWAIGGNASNGERFSMGRIGSIRFFNKAISSSEASALYTNDKFYT